MKTNKVYESPVMKTVNVELQHLMAGSPSVTQCTCSILSFGGGTGGSGGGRSREDNSFFEDDEEA